MAEGLRERKKVKARRDLERSALRLFARKGFADTTVDEIAAAVDLSPRTFFRYFASKEDVVFARAGEDLDALRACLRAVPADLLGYQAVETAVAAMARGLEDRGDEMKVRFGLVRANPLLRAKARQIAAGWATALAGELAARDHPERARGARGRPGGKPAAGGRTSGGPEREQEHDPSQTGPATPVEELVCLLAVSALWLALETWGAGESAAGVEETARQLLAESRSALQPEAGPMPAKR